MQSRDYHRDRLSQNEGRDKRKGEGGLQEDKEKELREERIEDRADEESHVCRGREKDGPSSECGIHPASEPNGWAKRRETCEETYVSAETWRTQLYKYATPLISNFHLDERDAL